MNRGERSYDEKRDFYRMAVDCAVTYRVKGAKQDGQGICRNLSAGGVLMEVADPLEPGTSMTIRIEPQNQVTGALEALAQVIRCDPDGSGAGYSVAATLLEIKR